MRTTIIVTETRWGSFVATLKADGLKASGKTRVDALLSLLCEMDEGTRVDAIMKMLEEPSRLQAIAEEHPPTAKDIGL
jgi:hypothetical protein